jgi:beta-ureidopropionase
VLLRDIDLDQIRAVRERWQFFRDRRPDAYGRVVAP